jgi:hypothetical protein
MVKTLARALCCATTGGFMRRLMIVLPLLLLVISAAASDDSPLPEPTQNPDATYRIFRTQNIYTLLRLDTRTGIVWQVQWGDENHRFIVPISKTVLVPAGMSANPPVLKSGRFTLSPTSNLHMFVLLDQEDGRTWQVQWGTEKERFVVEIPSL